MKQEKLNEILKLHELWLKNDVNGVKADLYGVDLCDANLRFANLHSADLRYANLHGADLRDANLRDADLCGADLCDANLCDADLCDANLRFADLHSADLRDANLCDADLCGVDLRYADLCDADLCGADLRYANLHGADLPPKEQIRKGIFVKRKMTGWKKCRNGVIVKLEIPKGAIVFSINNDKCRTNIAKVIEVIGAGMGVSQHDEKFVYEQGKTLEVVDFDLMYNVECSTGIHFFKTSKEAKNYEC